MAVLSRDNVRDQLRQRNIAPIYTLFGDETYLRDAAVKYIADLCFGEGDLREFNEDEYSLNSAENLKSALAAADQLPMMAARRVIRVTDVRVAATSNRDTLKEEFEAALANYLENPCGSSVVIFVTDELNGSRKLGKLLRDSTTAVEFARLDNAGLRKWAADHLHGLGAEADLDVVRRLVDVVGDDVRRLSNEAEKLAVAAMPGGKITRDMVDALVPFSRVLSNFGLTDNLVAGRKNEALRTLKTILDNGTEPLALLGLISSNYRRLLMASELLARGESRGNVASAVRAFGSGQDAFLAAARRIESKKLSRALGRVAETDLAIKTSVGGSGAAGSRLQLEMLVCELALL